MAREFRVRREQHLPSTVEQVWRAVATGDGNRGWLYPMEIEPRVGGTVTRGSATVTEWRPPHRFACRTADDHGFSNTLDYTVEPAGDGTALLRMGIHWVHEGEPDDGWDTRADAAEKHIDFYHHSLAQYLAHFDGRTAAYVRASRPAAPQGPQAFAAVRRCLGITADTAVGDTVRADLPADLGGPLEAVLDHLSRDFAGLRTADGLYRFFDGSSWNWPVWVGHHLFDTATDTEQAAKAWDAWLAEAAPC